jgi:N-acetyl-anhydromuramyl-L-alanine amidase AmpD
MLQINWIGANPGNWGPGRTRNGIEYQPTAIVIHIMGRSLVEADAYYNTPPERRQSDNPRHNGAPPSSSHYGIGRRGEVHQYVKEQNRSFHSGKVLHPTWPLFEDGSKPNYFTIGMDFEGLTSDVWTDRMMVAGAMMIADIGHRWGIAMEPLNVIPHDALNSHCCCPGPMCELDLLIAMARDL